MATKEYKGVPYHLWNPYTQMEMLVIVGFLLLSLACALTSATTPTPKAAAPAIEAAITPTAPTLNATSDPTVALTATLPPVQGTDPSYKVAAFYYPWYGNPKFDSQWIHWDQNGHRPPQDIGSDYYPALGVYSSRDSAVVAQHMAWLRQAGVGVIITSWWGPGSNEDKAVPLLLQMAGRYGIKVTFHIEPYSGRTANKLVDDIKYLYQQYGSDPAFFRSTATSRYSPSIQPKGMFFVWAFEVPDTSQSPVQADYWQKAMDAIHALPEGGLVIGNTLRGDWVGGAHVDGLYNYATLRLDQDGGFAWARSLPPDSFYIPSMIPGFSAKRVGYSGDTYVARQDGATYDDQWTAALFTGVQPEIVTITSFNEWHEGSMIEPSAVGVNDGNGYNYADFGSLPSDGYLTRTHDWIDKYLAATWPATYRARIHVRTTSDWTTLNVVSGGAWIRLERVSASDDVVQAYVETGDCLALIQSLDDAIAGKEVEMVFDVLFTGLDPAGKLVLSIERGSIGVTNVTVSNYVGAAPVDIKTIKWGGVTTGRNSLKVEIPASALMNTMP